MTVYDDPFVGQVFKRVLEQGDPAYVQVWFDAGVLDRYRGSPTYSVVRTDTIGRVSRPRTWSLDCGITPDGRLIHASLSDLLQRLPEGEREHWAGHIATMPVSLNFMRTRAAPGSCIDDGELRPW